MYDEALDALGYFLKPSELFGALASKTNAEGKAHFILDDLTRILNNIQQSTLGTASETNRKVPSGKGPFRWKNKEGGFDDISNPYWENYDGR